MEKKKRTRIDVYLAEKGLSQSREKAKREILSGWVKVDGETVREPSKLITGAEEINVARPRGLFVSRGGEKLNHALKVFDLDIKGKVAADIGSSTGGFTDCLLKAGASKVYAIDVGYGQLDYSLRTDNRVIVMERTNVRNLKKTDFDGIDFISVDLSFISVQKVFPGIMEVFSPADGIILIKPQFEAAKNEHKKGVVRKKDTHEIILKRVLDNLTGMGLVYRGLSYSPIKGPSGNIEFLLYFSTIQKSDYTLKDKKNMMLDVDYIIDEAHEKLNK
ncbi:TlyA family RNA methyltransferase [Spirochaetota bacterium]